MSRTRVKICGFTQADDVAAAVTAGVDAVGFITGVPVDTPREISTQTARDLITDVPPFVTSVVVTMPDTPDEAVDLVTTTAADAVQVHGTLTPAEIDTVRDGVDSPVIAAVDIEDTRIGAYADTADAVLVDSTGEDGGGGTGRTHDWTRSRTLRESVDVPLILAGGLTPQNVSDAVGTVDPFGVDTASGVEERGGEKDHDAVAQFTARAQQAVREA